MLMSPAKHQPDSAVAFTAVNIYHILNFFTPLILRKMKQDSVRCCVTAKCVGKNTKAMNYRNPTFTILCNNPIYE